MGFLFYYLFMSFGLLKHFKDLKRSEGAAVNTQHCQHLILGHDLGAVLKLVELRRNHPEEKVKLISNRLVNRQTLIENYQYGPALLRSKEAVGAIYRRFFNAKILPQPKAPNFYKDGKFHDFSGRAKPMDLRSGEEYFTFPGYKLELASLFEPEEWENLETILSEHLEVRHFDSVEKVAPSDLVDKSEWLLTFKDFTRLTSENLYVGLSPKKFLNLLVNKSDLTPEIIDFCSSVKVQGGISVTWVLDKEVYPEERTLFVPQSMTHEWGHFVVEFESFEHQSKRQLCHVLFLIQEEEPSPEDLGTKIKLMKRVLDRVFTDIEKHIKKEFIRFDDEMFISKIKDQALEQVGFDYPTLKFLGQSAPVPDALGNEKFLSRTLLSP